MLHRKYGSRYGMTISGLNITTNPTDTERHQENLTQSEGNGLQCICHSYSSVHFGYNEFSALHPFDRGHLSMEQNSQAFPNEDLR